MDLWALPPGHWQVVPGAGCVWSSHDDRRQVWLEPGSEQVLAALQAFAPKPELARRIAPLVGDVGRADLLIEKLRSRQLLTTPQAVLVEHGVDCAAPETVPALIVVRSRGRASSLHALLGDLVAQSRRFGSHPRHLVIDDSPDDDPRVIDAVRMAAGEGLSIALLGSSQRAPWLDELAGVAPELRDQGPMRALLDPGIAAATGARSWNAAVLCAAGSTLSLLDDDFRLPLRRGFDGSAWPPGLELGSMPAKRLRYHDDSPDEEALAFDGISLAQAYCGRPALDIAPDLRWQVADARGLTAQQLRQLARSRIGGVIVGTHGAYAWDSAVYLNGGPNPETLAALWRPPFDQARLNADRISLGVKRPSLVSPGAFTPLALDARALLPFAPTCGKADDTVFLALLAAMRTDCRWLELPWLVGHAPPEFRNRRERAEQPLIEDASMFLAARLSYQAESLTGTDVEGRWLCLGQLAAEAAAAGGTQLGNAIRRWRATLLANLVGLLRRALSMGGTEAPDAWRRHVAMALEANERALADLDVRELELRVRAGFAQLACGAAPWTALWRHSQARSATWYERWRVG